MIYGGLIDKIENKRRSEAKKEPSEREQFMKLMHTDLVEESNGATSKKPTEKREEETIDDEIVEYTNTLTVWLCDIMNSMHQNVELELIEIQNEGTCIRFCPIEHINVLGTDEKNLEAFADSLDEMIVIFYLFD